jgi:predicted phage tail protein
MIRTISFHGPLAERYKPVKLHADNFSMMLRGLQSVYPDIRRTLLQFDDLAIVKQHGDKFEGVEHERLGWQFGDYPDIHLSVGRKGAGTGAEFAFLSYTGWTAVAAYVAVNIAVAITLSFVMSALADTPQTSEGEERSKNASNLFNGATNVLEQGHPVPLIYGTFKVGSVTVSTEVSPEKQSIAMPDYIEIEAGTTGTGNVLANDVAVDALAISTFVVNGTSQNAGTTYTHASYSIHVDANGSYSITPAADFEGTFSFTYTASSPLTPSTTATVKVQSFSRTPYSNYSDGGA